MKTLEEKVEMLIKANQRLTNQLKEVTDRQEKMAEKVKGYLEDIYSKINELQIAREEKLMICGSGYIKEIELITKCNETDWRGSKWRSYELMLKGYSEVYTAFVPADIILEPDTVVQFSYEGEGKLKSLKVKNW